MSSCECCSKQNAAYICSGCYNVEYCSEECSKQNFEQHQIECLLIGKKVSQRKAKEMLKHGQAKGRNLTSKQKKYFGWIAGGSKE